MVHTLTIVESIWQNVSKTLCTCIDCIHVDAYMYMYCYCTRTNIHVHDYTDVHVHVCEKMGHMTQSIHTDHYSAILCRKLLNLVLSPSPDFLKPRFEFQNKSERLFGSSCLHRSHMYIYHCSLKIIFFSTNFDTSSLPPTTLNV